MLIGVPLAFGPKRHATREWLLASGVRVAIILIVAWLVLRVGLVMTARIERELSRGEGLDVLERTKRAQTIGRLVHNVLAVLIGSIALLMVLRELGIDIVPMLTGAGIAGVALGFGAQWLVRDVIAGFFLILENQVRVGDVAAINGVGGVVEAINLRTIVLRDGEGAVHVFPNGAINTLANRTKDFSFYVIDVNVLYDQDVDRVIEVLRATGQELEQDPAYRDLILAPLEIYGVDAFLDTKLTVKIRIKTVPLKQWDVGRELRRRILRALEQNQIPLTPAPMPLYVDEGGQVVGCRLQAAGSRRCLASGPEPRGPGGCSLPPEADPASRATATPSPGHRATPNHEAPPLVLGSDGDADARAPGDRARNVSAVLEEQAVAFEVEPVLRQADAERPREVARPATEVVRGDGCRIPAVSRSPGAHERESVDRFERAQQDRRRCALALGDDVGQEVDAVVQVDVGKTGWSIERSVAARRTRRGVAGRILFADVGFGLDDHT